MSQNTYRIVETKDKGTGLVVYEVWGRNLATGYEWLIAEYDTRAEARAMIQHWREAST